LKFVFLYRPKISLCVSFFEEYIYKLSHGDEVLADRGFLVSEELAAHGVTLRMSSFTRGKKQLSAMEVHKSKCLSNVRIHVERVIGKLRNYLILQSTTQ
jgi:hypothetical protein